MKTKLINRMMWQLVLAFGILVTFSACNDDFFALPDRSGIDARIWDNEGAIQFMLNKTYSMVVPDVPHQVYPDQRFAIFYADDDAYFSATNQWTKAALGLNGVLNNNDMRWAGAKYQFSNPGDNRYFDIARCNLAIQGLNEGSLPYDVKRAYLGQFYALRAIIYFNLTKVYGGVPLVLEPQDPQNLTLKGRESAAACFQVVFDDLDSAINLLDGIVWNPATELGKIDKLIAMCLKANVALNWASPQFNPLSHPTHVYEPQRWQRALEANKQAYELAIATGHQLMPDYGSIFHVEGTSNTEAIFVRSYSSRIERGGHSMESRVRPRSEGGSPHAGYWATKDLIEAYPMFDGKPIEGHPDYDPVLFWQNRDPRFEATIAYNGSHWKLSGNDSRRQWTYANASNESNFGFYCKRFANPDLPAGEVSYSNNMGGSGMDWIHIRLAEVMLDYAECANETGDITLAKSLVREIRQRAGIEEGDAGNDYGLGAVSSADQMREFIDNERRIEFAFEDKRFEQLRRRRLMHQLEGTIETLAFEVVDEEKRLHLEAINPETGLQYRDTLDINNKETFLYYFKYPYRVQTENGNGAFSVPEHYYFFTFQNSFMDSSQLLEHTIGWEGGTFDPLQ